MGQPWEEGRKAAEVMVAMRTRETPPHWYTERQQAEWYGGLIERGAEIKRAQVASHTGRS